MAKGKDKTMRVMTPDEKAEMVRKQKKERYGILMLNGPKEFVDSIRARLRACQEAQHRRSVGETGLAQLDAALRSIGL
jgi:hypothetical protein